MFWHKRLKMEANKLCRIIRKNICLYPCLDFFFKRKMNSKCSPENYLQWNNTRYFSRFFFCIGFVFLTDGKKQNQNQNQSNNSGMGLSAPSVARPLHPVQTTPLQQAGVPANGLSQATIHVLPTGNFF